MKVLLVIAVMVVFANCGFDVCWAGVGRNSSGVLSFDERFCRTSIVGLDSVTESKTESSFGLVTFRDTTTPFLSDSLDGTRCWRLHIDQLNLSNVLDREWGAGLPPFSLDAYVDSATGKPIRIELRRPKVEPDTSVRVRPPHEAAEFLSSFYEWYLGTPDKSPTVSFLDALRSVSYVTLAQRIEGYYVVYSRSPEKDGAEYEAWIVNLYGVPYRQGYWRAVIDANTGQLMRESNFP